MIFGHGVDPDLGDRIRVTVIATGFQSESQIWIWIQRRTEKKVHDLDRSQGWLFNTDNSVNEKGDFEVKKKRNQTMSQNKARNQSEREMVFTGPFNKVETRKRRRRR